jgi:threonine dehydrogenase-like Zn-dependent dehydrogenase
MPALVVRAPGEVALEDRPPLAPGRGEVLVHPTVIGVCGTDLDIVDGRVDPAFVRYPIALGHEWSGVVGALGDDVSDIAVGDLVVVEGIVPCGHCAACRHGDTNLCETYDEYGFTRDGAATDELVAPADLVHVLPAGSDAESAALVEPMAVVHRALTRLHVQPGERALVVGDGTVALLAVHLLQLWSPAEVVVHGRRPAQAELAATAGADRFTIDPDEDPGFDVVVEAAGAVAATVAAVSAARRGGRVGLLGFPGPGVTAALSVDDLVNNDVTITGSFSYTSSSWRAVVALLASGQIDPGFVVTHRFALQDWAAALAMLRSGPGNDDPRGKVLIRRDG